MAVYTEVSAEELSVFVEKYDIGKLISFKGIAEGVENSNFLMQSRAGTYILTLYEKRVDANDLPYFLALIEHLVGRGVPCATPVHDRNGDALQTLAGRPAAIFSFLPGVALKTPRPEHCAGVGRAAAQMHVAGNDFSGHRNNDLSVSGWRALFDACADELETMEGGLGEAIAGELKYLEENWPADLPSGAIHADLFPDNVFFLDGELSGIIDFYFACNDFLAYELAVCLNAWCFRADATFAPELAEALVTGYGEVRQLSGAELDALPILARGAALRFLLTRAYDRKHHVEGALVRPKDPMDYLLRLRFHQQAGGLAGYGLSGSGGAGAE